MAESMPFVKSPETLEVQLEIRPFHVENGNRNLKSTSRQLIKETGRDEGRTAFECHL